MGKPCWILLTILTQLSVVLTNIKQMISSPNVSIRQENQTNKHENLNPGRKLCYVDCLFCLGIPLACGSLLMVVR